MNLRNTNKPITVSPHASVNNFPIHFRSAPMDDSIEQFDWIPEQLTQVLEDILAEGAVQPVVLPCDATVADRV